MGLHSELNSNGVWFRDLIFLVYLCLLINHNHMSHSIGGVDWL